VASGVSNKLCSPKKIPPLLGLLPPLFFEGLLPPCPLVGVPFTAFFTTPPFDFPLPFPFAAGASLPLLCCFWYRFVAFEIPMFYFLK
jgi:hypothetical protein